MEVIEVMDVMEDRMDQYRREIDRIDAQLAKLLDERLDVAAKIGSYKQLRGLPVLDENREQEKIRAFAALFAEDRRDYVTGVIEAIMECSRNYQTDNRFDYALIGKGLGHSLSPQVHKALGGYNFGLIDLGEEELDAFFAAFPLKGITVTMPHKRAVMKYLDEISDIAKASGSVNTIVRRPDGTLAGHNTDYRGFRYTVERSGIDITGKKCLIFGSGGVSGTVRKVLEDCGAGEIRIISRHGEDNYENLSRHSDARVLVNATPVGMYPKAGVSPISLDMFDSCIGVFDLIYNPLRSKLILEAEDRGIPAYSGLDMLVAQAAYAGLLFTGEDYTDRIEGVCEMIRRQQENIVLIGMPGSGKTVIGKELAERTGKRFVDTDEYLLETCGKSAEEIILTEGEDAFRKYETSAIDAIGRTGGQVIATGGGVVEREENRHLLRSNGRIVYIRRDLDLLETGGRPISSEDGVEAIYKRRKDRYEAWQDLTVENHEITESAQEIKEKLGY